MKTSHKDYSDIALKVKNGTLTFKEFERLTGINWELPLTTLMYFADMSEDKCQERHKQITVFKKLNNIKMIIKILMDIKEKNKLTGEFATLVDMNESVINFLQNVFYLFIPPFLLIYNTFFSSFQPMNLRTRHLKKSTRKL